MITSSNPTAVANPLPVPEPVRERETFKYDDRGILHVAFDTSVAGSPDPVLTRFAELGLCRLQVGHCLISFFDRTHQYYVAEAIRRPSKSKNRDGGQVLHSQVVYCGTKVPRVASLCEHVLTGPQELTILPEPAAGLTSANLPVSVVPNLDLDSRFDHIVEKGQLFYAGVPIRSPNGVNIGVCCVMDDKARPEGLSEDQIRVLREVSETVMKHLETKRYGLCNRRSERILRGLASFVDGQATLSAWSDSHNQFFQDKAGEKAGTLNEKPQASLASSPRTTGDFQGRREPSQNQSTQKRPGLKRSVSDRPARLTSDSQLEADVEMVVSRGSNIIREAAEVEGVLILDARSLIDQEVSEHEYSSEVSSVQSENAICRILGFSTSSSSSINGDLPPPHLASISEDITHKFLRYHPRGRIFCLEAEGTVSDLCRVEDMNESSPVACWRQHQQRSYFESIENPKPTEFSEQGLKCREMVSGLQEIFTGAKSVAFVPLWDEQRRGWFAGMFIWTRTPRRIFTVENELSHLRVFSLTIMAEITRLNIRSADKTKTNILGSISHELRSPLHALVGHIDLLRSTRLERNQEVMAHAIDSSGRTLLDTIEHLLDYSKISNHIQTKGERRRPVLPQGAQDTSSSRPGPGDTEHHAYLDRVAEEVVESAVAGWTCRNRLDAQFASAAWDAGTYRRPGLNPLSLQPVQVLLDIERSDWSFDIHPGAFRRIVMNLLGNSLKFTKSGSIRVSLSQKRDGDSGHEAARTVVLTVTDTGKGISQDYLRDKLFAPFSQEDGFGPGVGMGLCLVRQIASDLGGKVDVVSQVSQGTTVTVTLPLPRTFGADEEDTVFGQKMEELRGRRILLHGFDAKLFMSESFRDGDEKQKSQLRLVEEICRDWLEMEVVHDGSGEFPQALDFVLCSHSEVVDGEMDDFSSPAFCPHVVVRQDPNLVNRCCSSPEKCYYLSPPIGPRKLADALVASCVQFQESASSEAQTPLSTPTVDDVVSPPLASPLDYPFGNAEYGTLADGAPTASVDKSECLILQTERQAVIPPQIATLDAGPAILVVEDNDWLRRYLGTLLAKLSNSTQRFVVKNANNGLEAVDLYTRAPGTYRCILTDISMPTMDGLESTRHIRKFEKSNKLDQVVVIALTADPAADKQREAKASGVNLFLTKPLRPQQLRQALEDMKVIGADGVKKEGERG